MEIRSTRRRPDVVAWCFLTPFLLVFAVASLWPMVRTAWLSLDAGDPLRNYRLVIFDPLAWLAAANTIGFAMVFTLVQTTLAVATAMLAAGVPRWLGRGLAAALFAAHVLGATFAGLIFGGLLGPGRGGLNAWLPEPVGWLTTPNLAMPVLLVVAAYVGTGFGTLWVLAALRRVDPRVGEAARVDGAGAVRRFRHATLPQIRPTVSMLLLAGMFWGLGVFELPYVLFGGPGPGYRVLTASMLIFSSAFERGDVGYASAAAVLFAGLTVVLTLVAAWALRVGREEVTL